LASVLAAKVPTTTAASLAVTVVLEQALPTVAV